MALVQTALQQRLSLLGYASTDLIRAGDMEAILAALWEVLEWGPLTDAALTGARQEPVGRDRTIQTVGIFDGATLVIQGSNDGTNWEDLRNPQGEVIEMFESELVQILEATRFIRPVTSGGGTAQSIMVYVFAGGL